MNFSDYNKMADFWRYDIGVNVIPAVSKTKKPKTEWKEWQETPIPTDLHEEWKLTNKFQDGMAIICGKTFHNSFDLWLNGLDFDTKQPLDDFLDGKTLAEMAEFTLVEQHANPDKAHILFYTEEPLENKNNVGIEIKSKGKHLLYCSGSIHKDNSMIKILNNATPANVTKKTLVDQLEKIASKYGTTYFAKSLELNQEALYKKQTEPMIKGDNRGLPILSYLDSLRIKFPEFDEEDLFYHARKYEKTRGNEPKSDEEIRALVEQSMGFSQTVLLQRQNQQEETVEETTEETTEETKKETTEETKKEKKEKKAKKDDDKDHSTSFVTNKIELEYKFKCCDDIKELFIYNDGYYTNKGVEPFVESLAERCYKKPSTYKAKETINALKRRNYIQREELEGNPDIYNFKNGLFYIDQNELKEHTPDYLSRNQFDFEYDPEAKCPNFEKFLESSLPEEIKRENVLEDMASCFLPQLSFKKIIMYVGEGYNGKSVLTNILGEMLGKDNVSHVSLKQFNRPFNMASLDGKFANIHSDIDKGYVGSLADLKVASTEDPLEVEKKGGDPYTIQGNPKLLFACNQLPSLDEDTVAIYARMRITEWEEQFLPNDPKTDPEITNKIRGEFSGIFNKLIPYILKLKQNKKFTNEETIEDMQVNYLKKSESALWYAKDILEVDINNKIPRTEVYSDYSKKCKELNLKKESPTALYKIIESELGVTKKKERPAKNTEPDWCWNLKIKKVSLEKFQEIFK